MYRKSMRLRLPTMNRMKLLLLLSASAECSRAATTLQHPGLPASLSHAGLENPESLTEALGTIELRSLQDILVGSFIDTE